MEPLTPQQAAHIAERVYETRTIAEVNKISGIQQENPFSVLDAHRLKGMSGRPNNAVESGFGYVAKGTGARNNEALIAIRGTATKADGVTDLMFRRAEGPSGYKVHVGFLLTFNTIKDQIDKSLDSIGPSGVHIVGHSLGGALANLTADYLCHKGLAVKVYSFGAPRVVTDPLRYSQHVGEDNIYRVYHTADPVSMVPIFPFQPVPSTNWGHFIFWNGGVGLPPHRMGNYLASVGEMQWSGLTAHTVTTRGWWQRQTKEWLEGAIPGDHYLMMGSGMALWTIIFALEQVIDDITCSLNNALIAGFTVLDRLAQLLYTGALMSVKIADKVHKIMVGILSFVGRIVDQTTTLTVAFIKWVLETLHRVVSTAALAAVCATFRH